MKRQKTFYRSSAAAVCTALCAILPLAFHAIPNGGKLFSPMHLPVLLCGIACGPQYGLLCGIMGPMLSSAVTGMPGMAILPTMMIELSVYGLLSGLMMHFVHTGKQTADLILSLSVAMLSGRILAGLASAFIFAPEEYSLRVWFGAYFVSCFPAIILQLILLPIIYNALQKAELLPNRNKR